MATHPSFRPVAPLPALWREWTQLVGQMAGRAGPHLRLTPAEYAALYTRIVALCDAHADPDSPAGAFYRHLGEVVRPWVGLHAIRQADGELLNDLHARAVAIDRRLHNGQAGPIALPRGVVRVTVALAVVGGLCAVGWATGLLGQAAEQAAEGVRAVRLWVARRAPTDWVWAVGVVLAVLACIALLRPRRG